MNNVYLIDYENLAQNIQYFITDGIPVKGDEVIVFFSKSNERFPVSVIVQAQEAGISMNFIEAYNGHKNALDFQLSSYLGFLISKYPEKIYHIMSKDKGYDSMIFFWKKQGINIDRLDSFMNSVHAVEEQAKQAKQEVKNDNTVDNKNVQKSVKKTTSRNAKKKLVRAAVDKTSFTEEEKNFIVSSFFNASSKERFRKIAEKHYGSECAKKMTNSIGYLYAA